MAIFNESKVRTKWSDDLKDGKGWFSDTINSGTDNCLKGYVEKGDKRTMYSTVLKSEDNCHPFVKSNGTVWDYFYPDTEKSSIFDESKIINALHKDLVKEGEEYYVANYITHLKQNVEKNHNIFKIVNVLNGYCPFITQKGSFALCYPVEKEYVPFTYEDREQFLGKVIKNPESNFSTLILDCNENVIYIKDGFIPYAKLLENYIFDFTNTPCGKKV